MKFAKSLVKNEVPEWSQYYIDYKGLKRIVKQAQQNLEIYQANPETTTQNDEVCARVSAPFYTQMDHNIEQVDNFYNSKLAEYSRRLRHVEDQFSISKLQPSTAEQSILEKEDLISMLLELRGKFRKLQWYAEINKRGFTKILKKFDKKVGTQVMSVYLNSKLPIMGFSKGQELTHKIEKTDLILREIVPDFNPIVSHAANSTKYTAHDLDSHEFNLSLQLRDAVKLNDPHRTAKHLEPNMTRSQLVWLILCAVHVRSDLVIPVLVKHYAPFLENKNLNDSNYHNIIQKAVISEGRYHVQKDQDMLGKWIGYEIGELSQSSSRSTSPADAGDVDNDAIADLESAKMINVLIKSVSEYVKPSTFLLAVDHQLRTAVHFAVKYDLLETTKLLLSYEPAAVAFHDADGLDLLDIAVFNKNPGIVTEILSHHPPKSRSGCNALLTAVRLNSPKVCEALLKSKQYDVNEQPEELLGETALHVAVRQGAVRVVEMLVQNGADVEIKEQTRLWTPLFIAAADGLINIAKVLLAAGADTTALDSRGWTAKEHAALRGHFNLAKEIPSPESLPTTPPSSLQNSFGSRDLTFGHTYLKDTSEHLVLVTLGSRDLRQEDVMPVQLDQLDQLNHLDGNGNGNGSGNVHNRLLPSLNTPLKLKVSATHSASDAHFVDLPTPELGLATEPIPFFTKELHKLRIVFDLVEENDKILARAVYSPPARKRIQDLNNSSQSVPVISATTLEILGQINFELLIVTPFVHPNNGIQASSSYWKSLIATRVIGHRGLGKNTLAQNNLQVGENTVESFIQASNQGASYVEFDVQLTKDNVPVIYHDFLVGDSGFDIPMHAMTLDQFMHIQEPSRGRSAERKTNTSTSYSRELVDGDDKQLRPKRSRSVHTRTEDLAPQLEETMRRMQYTRDYKTKGFKGNVRGLHIQSKFATLEELFKILPQNLGFNIEFKYAMLDEAEAEDMDGTMFEINHYVDTILKVIFDNKRERDIILSSFNPDVCILLKLKQPTLPILFLTESGTFPMMDIRASSLQEAIRFAKQFHLLGIVSEATPLIMCPRLVSAVKQSGLVCFTYGTSNNLPENARLQLAAGVDAVIVDSVYQIKEELKDSTPDDILVQELSKASVSSQN